MESRTKIGIDLHILESKGFIRQSHCLREKLEGVSGQLLNDYWTIGSQLNAKIVPVLRLGNFFPVFFSSTPGREHDSCFNRFRVRVYVIGSLKRVPLPQ